MAQKKIGHRISWTTQDVHELKAHSKARTRLTEIAKQMKRTEGALRRKAGILGIGLGHRRYHRLLFSRFFALERRNNCSKVQSRRA